MIAASFVMKESGPCVEASSEKMPNVADPESGLVTMIGIISELSEDQPAMI